MNRSKESRKHPATGGNVPQKLDTLTQKTSKKQTKRADRTKESQKDIKKTDTDLCAHMSIAMSAFAPIDETTALDFEVPPNKVEYFSKQPYWVQVTIELMKFVMQTTAGSRKSRAGTSPVNNAH